MRVSKRALLWIAFAIVIGVFLSYGLTLLIRQGDFLEVLGDGSLCIPTIVFAAGVCGRILLEIIREGKQGGDASSPLTAEEKEKLAERRAVHLTSAILLGFGAAGFYAVSQHWFAEEPNVARTLNRIVAESSANTDDHNLRVARPGDNDRYHLVSEELDSLQQGLASTQRDQRIAVLQTLVDKAQEDLAEKHRPYRISCICIGLFFLVLSGVLSARVELDD
jgi:hypothetical protein